MLFIVLSLFYFLWYWRQDLLSMHAMLLQAGTLSLPHMSASLIKTWPCALKLASPESKAFIAFLRIIMNCANQIRYKRCVYLIALKYCVLCHLKKWVAVHISQGQGNLYEPISQGQGNLFDKANETGKNNSEAAIHSNISYFLF